MNAPKGPKWPHKTFMLTRNWIEQFSVYVEVLNVPRGSPNCKYVFLPPGDIFAKVQRIFIPRYENEVISIK